MSDATDDEPKRCPVCGETDPYPAWFCMMRATGSAKPGQPCSYSREGNVRMGDALRAIGAALAGKEGP